MFAAEPICEPSQTPVIFPNVGCTANKVSEATQSVVALPTPVFVYLTYKVFGSVEVATSTAITFASTSEVCPSNSKPIKSDKLVVPEKEDNLTE